MEDKSTPSPFIDLFMGAKPGVPPPPPLPPYDINEDAPKWDWYRIFNQLPRIERHPNTPMRAGSQPASDDQPDWRGIVKNNVIPMPSVEPYKFGAPQSSSYFFFDTPDYADPFKKLNYSLKWFFWSGVCIASSVGILSGKGRTYAECKYLASRYMVPWILGGMTLSASVVTVANLRGNKDGYLNYIAAGLVTGCVTGRQTYLHHFRHSVLWVSGALIAKYNAEVNGGLIMRKNRYSRGIGMSGHNAEGGFFTGDFHFLKGFPAGDPGRDVRRTAY